MEKPEPINHEKSADVSENSTAGFAPNTPPTLPFLIYAHRGSTQLAPENTAVAFDLALRSGADVLETDVRLSADDQVMVIHDALLDRTTDASGPVRALPASTLQTLDAGYGCVCAHGVHWAKRGVRLMTLDELFERYPGVRINIDIKDNHPLAARAVADCIRRHQRAATTTTGSFHGALMKVFRRYAPELQTAATLQEVARLYFSAGLARASIDYQAIQIPTQWHGLPLTTPGFLHKIRQLRLALCYWTINDARQMRHLASLGVHGIVTDRPELAQRIRQSLIE